MSLEAHRTPLAGLVQEEHSGETKRRASAQDVAHGSPSSWVSIATIATSAKTMKAVDHAAACTPAHDAVLGWMAKTGRRGPTGAPGSGESHYG